MMHRVLCEYSTHWHKETTNQPTNESINQLKGILLGSNTCFINKRTRVYIGYVESNLDKYFSLKDVVLSADHSAFV